MDREGKGILRENREGKGLPIIPCPCPPYKAGHVCAHACPIAAPIYGYVCAYACPIAAPVWPMYARMHAPLLPPYMAIMRVCMPHCCSRVAHICAHACPITAPIWPMYARMPHCCSHIWPIYTRIYAPLSGTKIRTIRKAVKTPSLIPNLD